MRNVVIVAHPNIEQSRVNRALFSKLTEHHIESHNLYTKYPNEQIDVQSEQALLEQADRIVLQFPFYWYSSPSLLKKWIDQVMTHGWAYGEGGNALLGKRLLIAISTGGPAEAYQPDGYNRYSIQALLLPYQAMCNLTKLTFEDPFVISGVRSLSDLQLEEASSAYMDRLQS